MKRALFYLLVYAAILIGVFAIWGCGAMLGKTIFGVPSDNPVFALTLLVALLLGHVIVIWLFIDKKWATISWGSITKRARPYIIVLSFFFVLATSPMGTIIINLFPDTSPPKLLSYLDSAPISIVGIVYGCIVTPIAEELCFRGAVMFALYRWKRNAWFAILVSAVLFGFAHLNIVQVFYTFIHGVLMGWLFYRTGSLIPSIVVHVANNSLVAAGSLFFGNDNEVAGSLPLDDGFFLLFMALCLVLLFACCWVANRMFAKYEPLKV